MVNVCLTVIGIIQLVITDTKVQTLGDDLAIDAILFVLIYTLAFWSFKTKTPLLSCCLRIVVNVFVLTLSGMAGLCTVIAYAIF